MIKAATTAIDARSRSGASVRHSPDRLRDNRHSDQLKAMQETGTDWTLQCVRAVSKEDEQDGRWKRKGSPRSDAAEIAAPHQPNGKADLTASWSRQELAKRDKVGVGVLVEPTTSDNELVSEISDVSNRPAKAGDPEFAEGEQDFERRTRLITSWNALFGHRHRPLFSMLDWPFQHYNRLRWFAC